MIRDEIWSVSITRIRAFFDLQPDMIPTDTGYQFQECQITLVELPPKVSDYFSVSRTQVIFKGPDHQVSNIYHRFVIQFLTTGG